MKSSRLLNLMLLLQNRGRMTAREIAAEFEVSIRTVHRDVDALSQSGVPIYAERGVTGGIRLIDGYRTRLTGLTLDEAESLFLAGLPGPASDLGLGDVVAAAQLKILAALPAHLRERADRLRQRFLLDPGGWFQRPSDLPWLTTLADAVWTQRPIRIVYQRWGKSDNIVTREIDPLGLVLKAGIWYLIVIPDGQPRMYRVSRILDLALCDGFFDLPEDFDLERAWQICSREFEERIYTSNMTVRISEAGLARVQYFLSPFQIDAIRASADLPDDSGWLTVDVPTESVDHALWDVLKMAPYMEVVAPQELRQRVAETAIRLAGMHHANFA